MVKVGERCELFPRHAFLSMTNIRIQKDDHEPRRTAVTKCMFCLPLSVTVPPPKSTIHASGVSLALVVDDQ
jgi:hypothetical protein